MKTRSHTTHSRLLTSKNTTFNIGKYTHTNERVVTRQHCNRQQAGIATAHNETSRMNQSRVGRFLHVPQPSTSAPSWSQKSSWPKNWFWALLVFTWFLCACLETCDRKWGFHQKKYSHACKTRLPQSESAHQSAVGLSDLCCTVVREESGERALPPPPPPHPPPGPPLIHHLVQTCRLQLSHQLPPYFWGQRKSSTATITICYCFKTMILTRKKITRTLVCT